ncbi:TIR domain-containing protein [Candidatus Poribacteria bacterium]|nr:TIR domain-containing protein [Candidatus Poribacteria bacterium]
MECREKSDTQKESQVFLSYASADKKIAHRIVDTLHERGVRVWFYAYELRYRDSLVEAIKNAIAACDYLVVLLSPHSVKSAWVKKELGVALSSDLTIRGITLLPVIIADCEIPPFLASYQYLDLRTNFEQGVTRLVEQIDSIPKIDFSKLDSKSFENLVEDLLSKLGFKVIEREWAITNFSVNLKADYSYVDPFGVEVTETWLVEVKFYSQFRANLRSIKQLVAYLSKLPRSKGLLITDSQLTSAARDGLKLVEAKSRIEIRVIEGTELKRLLLQHRDLVNKYFVQNTGQPDE